MVGLAALYILVLYVATRRARSNSTMKSVLKLAIAGTVVVALFSQSTQSQSAPKVKVGPPLNVADLDRSVAACTDFYHFANGGWLKSNPIPPQYSTWGSFNELTERNNVLLREVLESAARDAKTTKDPDTRKVGMFYASCMDSAAAESAGTKPLAGEMAQIAAISNSAQLAAQIAHMHSVGLGVLFGFGSDQDAKNSSLVIASAGQGGLGLPNRDYYTKTGAASDKIRENYVGHITKMFVLNGETPEAAAADAGKVMVLETRLATASLTPVQLRDPLASYHPMSLEQADALTPAFSWHQFLTEVGQPKLTSLNIAHPDFFKAVNSAIQEVPIADWQAYLRWKLLDGTSSSLSSQFVNEDFAFRSTLTGAKEMLPRWRRCLSATDRVLGEALGREYVKVAFTPAAKAKALEMADNLRAVMRERIEHAAWMSEETRKQALVKLAAFNRKIGYPDKWRDYSALRVENAPYITNILNARKFGVDRDRAKIGKPVDRGERFMTPPTVNAYYSPQLNEVVFPAGRLQPPFFHPSYDDGANYGGIGGTIGHEMSHGFDDEGRQFDAQGNLRDWWTAEDAKHYTERATVVEKQYDDYTVLDTVHVNGKLTLGENLADVVGVSVAFDALERALGNKPRTQIDGFTPEQRFFLAYAQARRANVRPEQARLAIQTDPHSPGEYRVNGPLANMPQFAKAFGCKAGDAMVRSDSLRANIW
jgi:putative endopeptidase